MKKGKIYPVGFRRKRIGKTHYGKRLKILVSDKPRLVIRKSLKNMQANIVAYDSNGDKVLSSANSRELEKFGWKLDKVNLPSAYLVGFLLGKRAKKNGIKNAVLDLGLNRPVKGGRFYAALSGALDAGLDIPHNPKILPSKERTAGDHIVKYALKLKNNENAFKNQFNNYISNDIDPEKIIDYFNKTKNKIEEENNGKEKGR